MSLSIQLSSRKQSLSCSGWGAVAGRVVVSLFYISKLHLHYYVTTTCFWRFADDEIICLSMPIVRFQERCIFWWDKDYEYQRIRFLTTTEDWGVVAALVERCGAWVRHAGKRMPGRSRVLARFRVWGSLDISSLIHLSLPSLHLLSTSFCRLHRLRCFSKYISFHIIHSFLSSDLKFNRCYGERTARENLRPLAMCDRYLQ
jgi:hypothetical protein